jgi:hypothetical protein
MIDRDVKELYVGATAIFIFALVLVWLQAPIVRNGAEGRELATARWGMPSSQHALMEATKKRAAKLEAKGTSNSCFGWSRTAARPTSAT